MSMKCKTCKYWQDWSDRVFACVSGVQTNFERNRVELRKCRYVPPPTIESTVIGIYTDENYSCSQYSKLEE